MGNASCVVVCVYGRIPRWSVSYIYGTMVPTSNTTSANSTPSHSRNPPEYHPESFQKLRKCRRFLEVGLPHSAANVQLRRQVLSWESCVGWRPELKTKRNISFVLGSNFHVRRQVIQSKNKRAIADLSSPQVGYPEPCLHRQPSRRAVSDHAVGREATFNSMRHLEAFDRTLWLGVSTKYGVPERCVCQLRRRQAAPSRGSAPAGDPPSHTTTVLSADRSPS